MLHGGNRGPFGLRTVAARAPLGRGSCVVPMPAPSPPAPDSYLDRLRHRIWAQERGRSWTERGRLRPTVRPPTLVRCRSRAWAGFGRTGAASQEFGPTWATSGGGARSTQERLSSNIAYKQKRSTVAPAPWGDRGGRRNMCSRPIGAAGHPRSHFKGVSFSGTAPSAQARARAAPLRFARDGAGDWGPPQGQPRAHPSVACGGPAPGKFHGGSIMGGGGRPPKPRQDLGRGVGP